jgi:integrase
MDAGKYRDVVIDGAYKELFDGFISYKKGIGYGYSQAYQLAIRQLSRFLKSKPAIPEVISQKYCEEFCAQRNNERTKTQMMRRTNTRQFCLFLANKGYDCYIPPERQTKKPDAFLPYIISEAEMASIIAIADAKEPIPWQPNCRIVISMLLRILWCCGLRLSEALFLELNDVDLKAGALTIRKAKNNKSRIVPMSKTCTEYAKHYWERMGFDNNRREGLFFPSPRGGRYHSTPIYIQIRKRMLEAGVTRDGVRPCRVHDIRHSYAMRALEKMDDEGIDAYCCLPLLSAFMGHQDITSTEYYLRLTNHGHELVEAAMADAYKGIFPEVGDD